LYSCRTANEELYAYTSISTSTTSNGLSVLTECVNAVTRWHLENGLLLNPTKTEALVTGSRHQLFKFDRSTGIFVDGSVVQFNKSIRVLGVTVDELLSFDDHCVRRRAVLQLSYSLAATYTAAHRP